MTRYIRQERLGQGVSSTVYRGVDTVTGEAVAIKELVLEAGLPKTEVSLGRQITHVNVCRIFDFFQEGRSNCIAMEFVDGGNLRELVEKSAPLPLQKSLFIAKQILNGLEAAHGQNIVHRDLKPENILLTSNGTVKISDFGLAREIGPDATLRGGTPDYWAPEQAVAVNTDCDARADIYSFGVILHELLSGKRPQPNGARLPADVPRYMQSAIKRCLEMDPKRRFASVEEVRKALTGPGRINSTPVLTGILAVSAVTLLLAAAPVWNRLWKQSHGFNGLNGLKSVESVKSVAPSSVPSVTRLKRIAVLDFENLTSDKSLDPYTVGISETLSTELGRVRGLTLVERKGADAVVTGSFQKLGEKVRLTAKVLDARTRGVLQSPALVDGDFKDLFRLQAELAKQVAIAIQGPMKEADLKAFEAGMATGPTLQAFEAFSDGLYFLRKDLPRDALSKFDLTLALDPTYAGAYHYRGVALAAMNRLDEAIDAFKRALPRSEPERLALWTWEAPFGPQPGIHGIIRGMDSIQTHLQRDLFVGRKAVPVQKRIIYGERAENSSTVLHFLDLEGQIVRRVEVRDPNILLDTTAQANESFTVLPSVERPQGPLPAKIGLYAFSADATQLWHKELADFGRDLPRVALIGDAFFIYLSGLRRFDLLNARTGDLLWRRENLPIDGIELAMVRHTKAYDDILIIKSQNTYHAMRKSDGSDAWTVPVQSVKASELANDSLLIVFEPERRIFTVDLETGMTVSETTLEQFVDALPTPVGPKWLVGALLEGDTLYVMSKDREICAISVAAVYDRQPDKVDIAGGHRPPLQGKILWKTSINKRMQSIRVHGSHVYVGTDSGEVIVLNASNGVLMNTAKVSRQSVLIDYAGDDAVVVGSNNTVFGLDPAGAKKWEYPSVDPNMETTYFNGVITVYTSPVQMSALDVATGKVVWQYAGARPPFVFMSDGRFFVLEEKAAKQYAIRKPSESITDKQTLTELAKAYQAKGDSEQSRVFLTKVSEIDANYPPAILIRSQLLKARGETNEAGKELARYASLIGMDSPAGRRAISELKRDYGLLWQTVIGPDVAGDPVLVENRVVSAGRRMAREAPIIAVDAQTGAAVWRYTAERYAASAVVNDSSPALWYVTGSYADARLVMLYRIDIRSGERKQMASWQRPARVDQAWIAGAPGKILVATSAADLDKGTLELIVDCFDAASGARLWEQSHTGKASLVEFARPLEVLASMGFPSTDSPPPAKLPGAVLWNTSRLLVEKGRLYGFTDEGHVYAMRLD